MTKHAAVIPAPDSDLCLAFANTRYWRGSATPTEELGGPDELWAWLRQVARLPPALTGRFPPSATLFTEAIGQRETIYRCFAAIAAGGAPAAADLAALNAALAQAPRRDRVSLDGWDVEAPDLSGSALLAPALWSAADLLVGRQLARVRRCANPACGWLFFDNSKSGNRRWCSMSACGNRAKAHRHYQRQKAS